MFRSMIDARGLGGGGAHDLGILAEELERHGTLVGVHDQELVQGLRVAVMDREGGDHLAHREPGAVALGLQPHEPVPDPRQRCEQHAVGDLQTPELPRFMQRTHRRQG
jgi:hypothetical protein